MKVALILAPNWSRTRPPISLALLAAQLRFHNHTVFCFDLNNKLYHACREEYRDKWEQKNDFHWKNAIFVSTFIADHQKIINQYVSFILDSGVSLIGFSVYFPNQMMSLAIAKLIKARDKNKIIIFGGPQVIPSIGGREIVQNKAVDAIVIYEGDQTIVELARLIEERGCFCGCPGVIGKKDGKIIDFGEREPISNLDALPFTDFSDYTLTEYEHHDELGLLFSRGCINNCLFCVGRLPWQRYRYQSGDRMFAELKHQKEYYPQVRFFSFHDCLMNGNMEALQRFCQLIISEKEKDKLNDISWWCQAVIRPEMTFSLLEQMKQAGCRQINYGIESGSQKVINRIGKNFSIAIAHEVLKATKKAGIQISTTFMFGFPGEEQDDFEQTLLFLEQHQKDIDELIPSDGFCAIERISLLYKYAHENGLFTNPHPFYWRSRDGRNTYLERFRRFDAFLQKAFSLHVPLGGSYEKNVESRDVFLKNYYDYKYSAAFNICGNLVEKNLDSGMTYVWQMHRNCNYTCPYCSLTQENKHVIDGLVLTPDEWEVNWRRIFEHYGSGTVEIRGGEPVLYPQFFEIVKRISAFHACRIQTNLSQEVKEFVSKLNPQRVVFNLSFHLGRSSLEAFLEKALLLKKQGFSLVVYYLAYPPGISSIPYLKRRFAEVDLQLKITVFWGKYNKKAYPDSYTEEELDILKPYLGSKERICYNLKGESPKGKLCNAGYKRVVVREDGKVIRCRYAPEEELGDIGSRGFQLFDKPLPCNKEFCPYNEFDNVF